MSDEGVRVTCTELSFERLALRKWLRWLAIGLFALPLTLMLGMMTLRFSGDKELIEVLLTVMMGAPIVALASFATRLAPADRGGFLAVEGRELVVRRGSKVQRFPLDSLAEGFVSPLKGRLELSLKNGDRVHARVESVGAGRELLEAAGLDERRRTLEVMLGETTFLTVMTWLLGPAVVWPITVAIAQIAPWHWALNVWTFLALFFVLLRGVREVFGPARLVIGADGVILHQGFRDRFLPYERIAAVHTTAEYVDFRLTDETLVRAKARHLTREQHLEVEARIGHAMEAWKEGAAEASALARLDRNGRSSQAWREALTGLLNRDDGYREARVTREQLLAALGNASAPAERRLGAALALNASADPEVKARVRVAAEACANKRLRIALEKVAEGKADDEAVEEAIAEEQKRVKRM
jgi:hypothetical protein